MRSSKHEKKSVLRLIKVLLILAPLMATYAEDRKTDLDWFAYPMIEGSFHGTWDSLAKYEVPEWYRDAKLGFWSIIGPQCVPLQGDWYARHMYMQGSRQYKHHVEHYGHPSEFGYKDLIKLFNPTKLDYDKLMGLYKKAGGKYAVILAVHHDNFDLWNSKHHEWNSVNKGPKRDLVGEFRSAALKHGLRFGVTTHLARSLSWFQTNKGADTTGPKKGVSYDGNNPAYASLYHKPFTQPTDTDYFQKRYPINPPEVWQHLWYLRIKDLIDHYEPDFMYFDGSIPFDQGGSVSEDEKGAVGRRLMAHFYNSNMKHHGGKLEAVLSNKDTTSHGVFRDGVALQSIERGVSDKMGTRPWQTETCIGGWYYHTGTRYKSVQHVVHMLIDIVSKNGNLLLNIPLHPDGSIDAQEEAFLEGLGQWMQVNGKGLYDTRPWVIFGEQPPTDEESEQKGGHFREKPKTYTAEHFRFTCLGDDTLYAFFMAWPQDGKLLLRSLAKNATAKGKIQCVKLLGSDAELVFQHNKEGLVVKLPDEKPCNYSWALDITGQDLRLFEP
jgi:alpha-L-fucosidase